MNLIDKMKYIFILLPLVFMGLVSGEESLPILIFKSNGFSNSYCNGDKCSYVKNPILRNNVKKVSAINTNFLIAGFGILIIFSMLIINKGKKELFPKRNYRIVKT